MRHQLCEMLARDISRQEVKNKHFLLKEPLMLYLSTDIGQSYSVINKYKWHMFKFIVPFMPHNYDIISVPIMNLSIVFSTTIIQIILALSE